MDTKFCAKCGIEKELNEFTNAPKPKSGKQCYCKECCNKLSKEYYLKNKEKILKQAEEYRKNNSNKIKISNKKTYLKNREKYNEKKKKHYVKNKAKHAAYCKEYGKKWRKEKYKTDLMFRMTVIIRSLIYRALKGSKSRRSNEILGCSTEEFLQHLESKFTEGMSWENQGKWHVDHIIPISSAITTEELEKLSHYSNLQPLWAKDNLEKSDKIF
jgi:hypothetical protein